MPSPTFLDLSLDHLPVYTTPFPNGKNYIDYFVLVKLKILIQMILSGVDEEQYSIQHGKIIALYNLDERYEELLEKQLQSRRNGESSSITYSRPVGGKQTGAEPDKKIRVKKDGILKITLKHRVFAVPKLCIPIEDVGSKIEALRLVQVSNPQESVPSPVHISCVSLHKKLLSFLLKFIYLRLLLMKLYTNKIGVQFQLETKLLVVHKKCKE
jgi:hypothetical protein